MAPGPYSARFAARRRKKTGGFRTKIDMLLEPERYSGIPGVRMRRQSKGCVLRKLIIWATRPFLSVTCGYHVLKGDVSSC